MLLDKRNISSLIIHILLSLLKKIITTECFALSQPRKDGEKK